MTWRASWMAASGIAAALATAADAALLQRARAYFTGGFLASDYITTPVQGLTFLVASFLADLAVLGILVALALWLASVIGLGRRTAFVCAVALALVPVAASDFASYQLASYLGDAFDFGLMFSLAGRDVRELIAVSSAHVASIAWAAAGVTIAILVAGTFIRYHRHREGVSGSRFPLASALGVALALSIIGTAVTSAARISSDVLDNGLRRKPTGQWLGAAVNLLSDVDRDGYGLLGRPADPALFDSRVRPYALDVAGNGVDEDGVAGDLPVGAPYVEAPGNPPGMALRPDVVLVVLESFRADAVGASVEGRPVTPVLDALARQGVSVRHAYSHNGYTVQARQHIFSGSLADIRGTTLIDDFNANGYETAYFSGQDESFGGTPQGAPFERAHVAYDARTDKDRRYSTFSTPGSLAVPYPVLLERVTAFLRARRSDKPLFLYVNFHDTHFPYHHRGIEPLISKAALPQDEIGPGRASELQATYLNTAANVDRAIGQLLATATQSLGRTPGTVVLSDHGESLFDEGFLGHGYALNEAQTLIPLIIANLPATVPEPVGQSEVRDILRQALATPGHEGRPPVVESDRSRSVFQYLGNIDRPAQISLTGVDRQVLHDFRSGRARVDGGSWMAPDALGPEESRRWRELVTTWERMLIARDAWRTRRGQ